MFSIIDAKGGNSGDCPPGVFARRGFSRDTFMTAGCAASTIAGCAARRKNKLHIASPSWATMCSVLVVG